MVYINVLNAFETVEGDAVKQKNRTFVFYLPQVDGPVLQFSGRETTQAFLDQLLRMHHDLAPPVSASWICETSILPVFYKGREGHEREKKSVSLHRDTVSAFGRQFDNRNVINLMVFIMIFLFFFNH